MFICGVFSSWAKFSDGYDQLSGWIVLVVSVSCFSEFLLGVDSVMPSSFSAFSVAGVLAFMFALISCGKGYQKHNARLLVCWRATYSGILAFLHLSAVGGGCQGILAQCETAHLWWPSPFWNPLPVCLLPGGSLANITVVYWQGRLKHRAALPWAHLNVWWYTG